MTKRSGSNPNLAIAYYNRGLAYDNKGNLDKAKKETSIRLTQTLRQRSGSRPVNRGGGAYY
jgi:hypothetical protein